MHLRSLEIRNFRAIALLKLTALTDFIVLAGPNGCGKSCVLDALRLIKSAYGSYQSQDEVQTWFGEFQINQSKDPSEFLMLFQDRNAPLFLSATFSLSHEEKSHLHGNLASIVEENLWAQVTPRHSFPGAMSESIAAIQRENHAWVQQKTAEELRSLRPLLDLNELSGSVRIQPGARPEVTSNPLLEVIFRTYQPSKLGVIDFHSAHRVYGRERVGNVNLTIESDDQQLKQNALYNSAGKYANLKSQMAGAYVRHLLARQFNPSIALHDPLTASLKELFNTFFPGKEFLGPQPTDDGRLLFPVRLRNGSEHDIDELSSGEKEILYGYLRLKTSAPRNSIIMIDEPELHLNPRVINGLAEFYHRHIGRALANQLLLVTHSDTLIREAVANSECSVFHVQPVGSSGPPQNQATRVQASAEIERLVIDLVGDLAAYRPGAKVVIFESTEDAAFDVAMTFKLFPDLERQVNPISAGEKGRVHSLHSVLESVRTAGKLDMKFFSITDPDDDRQIGGVATQLQWDVYHIENYLIHPKYILRVCRDLDLSTETLVDEEAVTAALIECAAGTIPSLVAHQLRSYVNKKLVSALNLKFNAKTTNPAAEMIRAVESSYGRIKNEIATSVSAESITGLERTLNEDYTAALTNGEWSVRFRGRDILQQFVKKFVSICPNAIRYTAFRELILARMQDDRFKPRGMQLVVSQVLDD